MTIKLLDCVGAIVVAVAITKAIDIYGEYKYNQGFKKGKENK